MDKAEVKQVGDTKVDVSHPDLRVGRVITTLQHPEADCLYVQQVDVGEAAPRTAVSKLAKHIPMDQVQFLFILM